MPQNSNRIEFIDVARGVAIILVVLGHAIQYQVNEFDNNYIFRLIYAVHMPLFMFISGYVTKSYSEYGASANQIYSRSRRLLLPFIAWIPISFVSIVWIQQPHGFNENFVEFVGQVIQKPDAGGLWFLIVLYECQLLITLASLGGERNFASFSLILLVVVNVVVMALPSSDWLGLGLLRWYFMFFLAGIFFRKEEYRPVSPRMTLAYMAIYTLLVMFWYRKSAVPVDLWLNVLSGVGRRLAVQGYHALTAFSGIISVLGVCLIIAKSTLFPSLKRTLIFLGKVSLEIYAGHYLFLYIAVDISKSVEMSIVLKVILVLLFSMSGALLLRKLLNSIPLLHVALYGR